MTVFVYRELKLVDVPKVLVQAASMRSPLLSCRGCARCWSSSGLITYVPEISLWLPKLLGTI